MLSRKAFLIAAGASSEAIRDAPIAYGSTTESTIQLGGGVGVKAIRTVIKTAAMMLPRTNPNAAPSSRSSHDNPVHLNSFESKRPTSAPRNTNSKNTMKNPARLQNVFDLTKVCSHAAGVE